MTEDNTRSWGLSLNTLGVPRGLECGLLESEGKACTSHAAALEEVQGPASHSAGYRLSPELAQQAWTLQWARSPGQFTFTWLVLFLYFFLNVFLGIIAMPHGLSHHWPSCSP